MANSPVNITYLPDDLLLNCLARISRLYYPTLSLVSKRFRSIVASFELYQTRMLLGRTDKCLYVSLRFGNESDLRWFTLCRRPTRIPNPNPNHNSRWFTSCFSPHRILTNRTMKKEKKSGENLMVSVKTRNFTTPVGLTSTAKFRSYIYMIEGGYINSALSYRRLSFMDCWSHTLHETPSMEIWCAEISLERRNGLEIYGKIEWCDVVLTLSEPYDIVHVTTVTV